METNLFRPRSIIVTSFDHMELVAADKHRTLLWHIASKLGRPSSHDPATIDHKTELEIFTSWALTNQGYSLHCLWHCEPARVTTNICDGVLAFDH